MSVESSPIVIQCATLVEFEALREAWPMEGRSVGPIERVGKRKFFRADPDVIVFRGAIGKVWAAASAEFAIGRWAPRAVIDFGAAGALAEELHVGDLLLATEVVEHDVYSADDRGPPRFGVGPTQWNELDAADLGLRVARGCLAAGDRDVQTPEERRELAQRVSAIAVTWESAAVGRVCGFHGVSYLSVRVITDRGDDEFLAEYRQGVARTLLPAARWLARHRFDARAAHPHE